MLAASPFGVVVFQQSLGDNGKVELHQLRYFCAVASTGSFTRAAEQEGVAQPSLSQQIRRLETAVGAPLFLRLGRSVRLTPHGAVLLPHARAVLQRLADAQSQLTQLGDGTRGVIRVGSIPTVLPYLLAPYLGQFSGKYPEVEVRLTEDITTRLIAALQAGDLDIAVLSLPVRSPDIVCSELFREQLLLAVSKNHRLAKSKSAGLGDVYQERLLLLKEGHCFRNDVLTACTRARTQFHSVFESDQFASIFPLVAGGTGVSLIPQMAAAHADDCALVPLTRPQFRRIGYARVRRHFSGKPLRAFLSWLREIAGQHYTTSF